MQNRRLVQVCHVFRPLNHASRCQTRPPRGATPLQRSRCGPPRFRLKTLHTVFHDGLGKASGANRTLWYTRWGDRYTRGLGGHQELTREAQGRPGRRGSEGGSSVPGRECRGARAQRWRHVDAHDEMRVPVRGSIAQTTITAVSRGPVLRRRCGDVPNGGLDGGGVDGGAEGERLSSRLSGNGVIFDLHPYTLTPPKSKKRREFFFLSLNTRKPRKKKVFWPKSRSGLRRV